MSAYTHRLLKHLLGSLDPEMQEHPERAISNGMDLPIPAPPPTWTMPSTQQIIQEQLWHPNPFDSQPPHAPPVLLEPQQQVQNDLLFPAADDDIWKLLFPL